ncbi:MAG: hypothetical protein QN194_11825 [Armatimonadota bacterium]|nr:hypothetical protein [Armatimonadota bacterium]
MRLRSRVGIGLVSAAGLLMEIALTRIFSIVQWYHFAFLAVGIGLLGYGASGTLLTILGRDRAGETVSACAAGLFPAAVAAAYGALLLVPFDAYRIVLEPVQFAYLAAQLAAMVLPFLCAGLAVGGALAARPQEAGSVYAASLVGSGAGCLLAVGILQVAPAPAALLAAAGLGAAGAGCLWPRPSRLVPAAGALTALLLAASLTVTPPLRLSPYKALSQYALFPDARITFSRSNAVSRVDVVASGAIRAVPGLSPAYRGRVPPTTILTLDGDAPRPLPGMAQAALTAFIPSSAVYALRRGPTLVLDGGAGFEILGALRHGMPEVVVVESNPLVLEAAVGAAPSVFRHPRLRVVREDVRVFLRREKARFDVVHLPPRESFQVIASGAYSLTEHYLYTVEAFRDLIDRLTADGILVVTRWLQQPPSEEVKVWAAAAVALEQLGLAPAAHLAAVRSLHTATLFLGRRPWTAAEVARLAAFAASRRFDVIYAPGLGPETSNRFNVLPVDVYRAAFTAMLAPATRRQYIEDSPFDIAPATDSRPFFFHFFRRQQVPAILAGLGRTWQPFGGGGYLVILGAFAVTLLLSILLVLWPLRRLGTVPARAGTVLVYFLLLGAGYLFVEIPLMQQGILLLGHPTYAVSVVLFGLLTASGIGSAQSGRLLRRLPHLLGGLAGVLLLTAPGLGALVHGALGLPLGLRVVLTLAVVVLLGVPMGVPFAAGIQVIARRAEVVPWAWAVNGCASVLSATGAVLAALQGGFPVALGCAAVAYGLAAVAAVGLRR